MKTRIVYAMVAESLPIAAAGTVGGFRASNPNLPSATPVRDTPTSGRFAGNIARG